MSIQFIVSGHISIFVFESGCDHNKDFVNHHDCILYMYVIINRFEPSYLTTLNLSTELYHFIQVFFFRLKDIIVVDKLSRNRDKNPCTGF